MNFSGSQTEKNLLAAFAGESQARNRYTFFASVAKKEGYEQIGAIFEDTAANEKEHAEEDQKRLEEAKQQQQRADEVQNIESMPVVIIKNFDSKGGGARKEELLNVLAQWAASLADGQVCVSSARCSACLNLRIGGACHRRQ